VQFVSYRPEALPDALPSQSLLRQFRFALFLLFWSLEVLLPRLCRLRVGDG